MASLGFLPDLDEGEGDTSLNVSSSPGSSPFERFLNLTGSSEESSSFAPVVVDEADELTPKCGNLKSSSKLEQSSSPQGCTASDQLGRHCAQDTPTTVAEDDESESLTLNPFSHMQEDTDDESTEQDSFFALKLHNQFVLDEQAARWHYFDTDFPHRPIARKDDSMEEEGEISAITGGRSWDESLFSASSLIEKEEIFSKDLLKEPFPPQEQEVQEDAASALMNELGCCTDFQVNGKTRLHSPRNIHSSSATLDKLAQLMTNTMCSQETSGLNCSLAETSVSDEGYVEEESIELFLEDDGETVSLVDQQEGEQQISEVAKRAASQALRLTEGIPHAMRYNSKGQKKLNDYLNKLELEDLAIMKSYRRKVYGEVHL